MTSRLLALFLAAVGAVYAADWDFDRVVHAIESNFGVKQTHIPLMGVANFVVKVAHPAGAHGFKLAVFEDIASAPGYGDIAAMDGFMDGLDGHGMHPLVVTHSRPGNESTYILAGEIGKTTKMLIATFGRNEATVVEVRVDIDTLLKTIGSPKDASKLYGGDRQDHADRGW